MTPGRQPKAALILGSAILSLIWALFWAVPHLQGRASLLDRPESLLTDLRLSLAGVLEAPADLVIVALDDRALAPEAGGFPVSRARLAGIVGRIAAAGPRVLAVDILLVDPTDVGADAALARAFGQVPTVVAMAGTFASDAKTDANSAPRSNSELWPMPLFAERARVGHVNVVQDLSGVPRHIPLVLQTSRGVVPSLVVEAAAIYLGTAATLAQDRIRFGEKNRLLDAGLHLPLRLAGPTGTISTISAQDLMAGDPALAAALADKLVILGFTAKAVGDTFPSPFGDQTPGVEVLGSAIATLIGGPGLARTESIRLVDLLATVLLATAGAALVARVRLSVGLPVALAAVAGWLAGGALLFASGLWFSAALPLIGVLPPILATAVLRQRFEQRAARRLDQAVDALRVFHPGALAERITEDPQYLAQPISQDMAILFVDIAGFTAISEALGPSETRTFLKDLHNVIATVVSAGQGIVLNFMGDGAMAVFGLPEPGPKDPERALHTAFALVPAVRALRLPDGTQPDLRVGVNFGPVIVSRLGHDQQQQVTISGDAVNLASRLIDIAKDQSATVVASMDLTERIPAAHLPVPEGRARNAVRGRVAEVDIAFWRTVPKT